MWEVLVQKYERLVGLQSFVQWKQKRVFRATCPKHPFDVRFKKISASEATHCSGQGGEHKRETDPYPFGFYPQDDQCEYQADPEHHPVAAAVLCVFFVLFHVRIVLMQQR